jgi:hypothetical protein
MIQIRHAHQLLHVGTADQGATEDHDLLIDVRLHCQAGHQRLQHRLGVYEDTRRSFILVGHPHNNNRGDNADNPSDNQPDPPPLPHASRNGTRVAKELVNLIHGLS